jgi:acetyl-CoA acetyltransferase
MSRPAIIGIDEGSLDNQGRPCVQVAAGAVQRALGDAGLKLADLDAVLAAYAWEEPSIMFAAEVAEHLGVEPAYAETVCFGGASPAMAIARAARAVSAGICEVAAVTVASNRASKIGRAGTIAALRDVLNGEFELPYGAFVPPVYAMMATRFMHDTGTSEAQLAAVAAAQRAHAERHPRAAFRTPLSIEDVLSSPMISSPLHKLDCCLVTDFGGAVIVASGDCLRDRMPEPVWVLGAGEAHDRLAVASVRDLSSRGAGRSALRALTQAGLSLADIEFAELYDSFTSTVLMTIEDIGFCGRGEAGQLMQEGAFSIGGRLPINTNGGMLSYRTGGISHVTEAVRQLRGTAEGVEVDSPRHALVHGIGGAMSSHCTLVLGQEEAA